MPKHFYYPLSIQKLHGSGEDAHGFIGSLQWKKRCRENEPRDLEISPSGRNEVCMEQGK